MTLHAGHCSRCDCEIFRFAAHGRTGERVMLYPKPDSVYAHLAMRPGSVAPGIGYCADHAPPIGKDGVVGLDLAGLRYAAWFTPKWGQHFASWLQDHMELPEHERDALIAQWRDDCKATEGVHA